METRERCLMLLVLSVIPSILLLVGRVDPSSAQVPGPAVPATVETPYTLIDAETRTRIEVGAEGPLRGNGPVTGYAYAFLTQPHFLAQDLYLRTIIAPVYVAARRPLYRDTSPV